MMAKWEGGDPGVINQKTPSILLLTPEGKFHSFGFTARNHYHDLSPEDAMIWMYFDKYKMTLYNNAVRGFTDNKAVRGLMCSQGQTFFTG